MNVGKLAGQRLTFKIRKSPLEGGADDDACGHNARRKGDMLGFEDSRIRIASSSPSTRPEPSIDSSDGCAEVTGARRGEAAGLGPILCASRKG